MNVGAFLLFFPPLDTPNNNTICNETVYPRCPTLRPLLIGTWRKKYQSIGNVYENSAMF